MRSRSDFRDGLYERYVSAFKSERGAASFEWWDHKLLPLFSGLSRAASILELGCGDGSLLAYLRARGFTGARGVDISAEQVALAQTRGVDAETGDLFETLRMTSKVAALVAVDVLEHLSRDELVRLAPLLFDALAPGGRLIVQTCNGAGLLSGQVAYGDLTHLTILTPESLAQLLRPAGFVDIRTFETGPAPLRIRGKLNVAMWSAITFAASAVKYVETGKRQRIWTETFLACASKP